MLPSLAAVMWYWHFDLFKNENFSIIIALLSDQDPSWPLLISIKKPDGGEVRINDAILDFHDKAQCIQFARILLTRQDVMRIVNDRSKREKKDFVRAVLDKWLSSGSSSWQQLVDSMRDADMDKDVIDEIAINMF